MSGTRIVTRASSALALAALLSVGGVAHAAAPDNGCPEGYQLLSVADLTSQGYVVAGMVDDPHSGVLSYGRPANGDGLVCARQMGNKLTHFGGPYYNFLDDGLPAS